ncbi:MAG: DUF1684 domain-containing protein [Gammaproteobacteria bacterium]|nr:DUF1684 domain-containing protein [Gammaproteobacteria bacterium]
MTIIELLEYRRERDRFFAESYASPLPDEDRASFTGLSYFPPKPALAVRASLLRSKGTARIAHTTGADRSYHVVGTVEVTIEGRTRTLTVLNTGDGEAFIPIRDTTAGTETYEGGRYVPVEIRDDGIAVVDFNLAQNPWCVYDDEFACPLPPPENVLPFPLRAGEMTYEPPAS